MIRHATFVHLPIIKPNLQQLVPVTKHNTYLYKKLEEIKQPINCESQGMHATDIESSWEPSSIVHNKQQTQGMDAAAEVLHSISCGRPHLKPRAKNILLLTKYEVMILRGFLLAPKILSPEDRRVHR